MIVHSIGASSDSSEVSSKNSTIAVRSNRDRGAIEPRSGSLFGGIASSRSDDDRRMTRTTIVAQSRRDRGENCDHFEAKLKQNRG